MDNLEQAALVLRRLFKTHDAPKSVAEVLRGGPGSGFHGHAGRPGELGGSAPGEGGGKSSSGGSKPSGDKPSGNKNAAEDKDRYFSFLNDLKKAGVKDVEQAFSRLQTEFKLSEDDASAVLTEWAQRGLKKRSE